MHSQILIAENNGIIAADIQSMLMHWGYGNPDLVDSADETFAIIKYRQPDLIVMGTRLKDNDDCLNLATWIHKIYHVPTIAIVDWSSQEIKKQACQLNSFYCLAEPFDTKKLKKLVTRALNVHRN